ncbi:hypothetical protein BGZ94_009558 [Podila epigama]|nr:hypothetical protein BGZ94_009558 [Podila epigama]
MPLVYGSTPEKVGSIKGTVRFSSNYDCKGKDISIIYEAIAESHWQAVENKKVVRHQTHKVLGWQEWHFPLVHTRPGGSMVAAGDYSKDFEVQLVRASDVTAKLSTLGRKGDLSSTLSPPSQHQHLDAVDSSPWLLPSTASMSTTPFEGNACPLLLPSTTHSPQANVRYSIRAVLHRPFPSITNVEASQEIWVLHSSLPPPSLLQPRSPSPSPNPAQPQSTLVSALSVGPSMSSSTQATQSQTGHNISAPATKDAPESAPESVSEATPEASKEEEVVEPQRLSALASMTNPAGVLLSVPGKAIKTALSALLPVKRFSSPEISPSGEGDNTSQDTNSGSVSIPNISPPSVSPLSSPLPSPTFSSPPPTSSSMPRSQSHHDIDSGTHDDASSNEIQYTGVWEPFDVPYCFSIPSETLYLGQRLPLTIEFGPRGQEHVRPRQGMHHRLQAKAVNHTGSIAAATSQATADYQTKERGDSERSKDVDAGMAIDKGRDAGISTRLRSKDLFIDPPSEPSSLLLSLSPASPPNSSPESRFVIKKGILKLVEYTLLREVTVFSAPSRMLNVGQRWGSEARQAIDSYRAHGTGKKSIYGMRTSEATGSHPHLHTLFRGHQGHGRNESASTSTSLLVTTDADADAKKRHSLDHPPLPRGGRGQLSHLKTNGDSNKATASTPRIMSSFETRYKVEVMSLSLTPLFVSQERDRRRRMVERQQQQPRKQITPTGQDEPSKYSEDDGYDMWSEDDDTWRTTVWLQIPGPNEMSTGIETRGIVKTHRLQLLLLCGETPVRRGKGLAEVAVVDGHLASSAASITSSSGAGAGAGAGTGLAKREFRLEMDIHITGPREPLSVKPALIGQ